MRSRWQAWSGLAGVLCLAFGAWMAMQHPVAPRWALALLLATAALVGSRPGVWLWLVPAALPALNFGPWTGGMVIEEFDLLVLGVAAGLRLRDALLSTDPHRPLCATRGRSLFVCAASVFALLSIASLVRGVIAAGGLSFSGAWFQGYEQPLNAWRVFKSVAWAALLWPPLGREIAADRDSAVRRFVGGMLTGLLVVVLAVVWERAAYPGLWEFSGHYRTTALFWEMHVGGGAIDIFLALAAPLVAWVLWSQKSPGLWGLAATLALLTVYACLTTFSRGVYFAVAAPLVALGVTLVWRRVEGGARRIVVRCLGIVLVLLTADTALAFAFGVGGYAAAGAVSLGLAALAASFFRRIRPLRWRPAASFALALALVLEVFAVLGVGSFMRERIAATDADYGSRLAHWKDSASLLRTPSDWLLGIGSGRVPSGFASRIPGVELPGDVIYVPGRANKGSVVLQGPRTRPDIDGLMLLNQRINLHEGRGHRVALDVRVATLTDLYLRVCEAHLLYARECQTRLIRLDPGSTDWRHVAVSLAGRSLTPGVAAWPRRAIFSMSVVNPGGSAELDNVQLQAPDGTPLLLNGDFSNGMAHWLPTVLSYFLPWHVDNLYLELLIERGVLALLAFGLFVAAVAWRLLRVPSDAIPFAPFLLAAICGPLCAGLVNSIMDAPRVAFLLFFVLLTGAELGLSLSGPTSRAAPAA